MNPALLISSLILGYISIVKLFYDLGLVAAHNLLLFMMLFALPLVIFISAVFLIYNGCILLKREGMSKTNLLSLSLGVLILLFFALMFIYVTGAGSAFITNPPISIMVVIVVFSYMLFGTAFAGFILYSILYLAIPKNKHYDFIIIQGAGP